MPGARIDRGFAVVAHLVSAACGNKQSTVNQWMPKYSPDEEPEEEGSLADVAKILGVKQ